MSALLHSTIEVLPIGFRHQAFKLIDPLLQVQLWQLSSQMTQRLIRRQIVKLTTLRRHATSVKKPCPRLRLVPPLLLARLWLPLFSLIHAVGGDPKLSKLFLREQVSLGILGYENVIVIFA